jgi:hypothetical protein
MNWRRNDEVSARPTLADWAFCLGNCYQGRASSACVNPPGTRKGVARFQRVAHIGGPERSLGFPDSPRQSADQPPTKVPNLPLYPLNQGDG